MLLLCIEVEPAITLTIFQKKISHEILRTLEG